MSGLEVGNFLRTRVYVYLGVFVMDGVIVFDFRD